MHRIYLLGLSLLLAAAVGHAQEFPSGKWWRDIRTNTRTDEGTIYLRANLLGLVDIYDGNFSVGGEYRLNRSWSVTMDAGYIFYSTYILKAKSAMGVLLRPGIRLYTDPDKKVFVECQFHYKGVRYHVTDWLGKEVVNNVPAYEEMKEFQYQKRVVGAQIMVGYRNFLWKSKRLFVEGYLGLGIHYKEENLYHEPNSLYDHTILTLRRVTSEKTTRVLPAVPGGIRLVYLLR